MSRFTFGVLLATLAVLVAAPSVAQAETEGTGWEAFVQAYPTNLHPGGSGTVQIDLMNTGARPSSGPIVVTDTFPRGIGVTAAGGMFHAGLESPAEEIAKFGGVRWSCETAGTEQVTLTCTSDQRYLRELPVGAGENFFPIERIGVDVQISEHAPEGALENRVTIAGGGASETAVLSSPIAVSSSEPGYGFSGWDVWFTNADGTLDTQAGSHPYETTFAVGYNELAGGLLAGGEQRELEVELPPGFSGEPSSAPRCTRGQLSAEECPPETQIGEEIPLSAEEGGGGADGAGALAVYNMVPPPGIVDEFASVIFGKAVFFDTAPRGYGRYDLVTRIDNIPANNKLDGNILRLWGVAPEPSHDRARDATGISEEDKKCRMEGCPSSAPARPFLTLPSACEGPQPFRIFGRGTWEDEGARAEAGVLSHNLEDLATGFTGCSKLSFYPSLTTSLETGAADSPAGLGVDVGFPQEALRVPGRLIEASPKNTTVTLPEGLVLNPGQAAGLAACTQAQAKLKEEGAPECPSASKVGTVKVKTPLLEGAFETELTGSVYVLAQSNGGPGEPPNLSSDPPTLQLLIAIAGDGVNLKLVANVALNETTGRLTTTLTETPGLPFTHFELSFSGGAQAALATPAQCGSYTTTSDFTPWSTPFDADLFPSSGFTIDTGADGGACPSNPLPFQPELIAGATNPKGGAFTSFSLLLRRGDGQQRIEKLQFKAPEGLSGMLSSVPLCGEPQAGNGECTAASQIGHASVASGPGPYPLVIPQPGNPESPIYLTGPYNGTSGCTVGESGCAPFGLSILTHVIAGPFDLGNVVTRAKIEINPLTAQITVTTNPLPQILDGVPTDLRLVDSVIERPGGAPFMFNPTHCAPSSFSGTAWGTPPPGVGGPGATAAISDSFDVVGCKGLAFAPKFSVSTSGKTSKSQGASLTAKIVYPSAPQGTQADIGSVKVDLPKQLPSRLTTLQKACTAAQFNANPAGCPAASVIGHAVVHTPVLPVPLEGPAYFVSNGGEAFPNLIIVLQGEGVEIELVGDTFISKAGITSSTFKAVPDQPFSSFELTLGEGPYSALAANGDLCTVKGGLKMPTEFTAQNGAVLRQSTVIEPEGCADTITILSHKLSRRTVTLKIAVPAAGKLTAGGKGLTTVAKSSGGRGAVTITLKAKGHHKLNTKVKLSFKPSKGKALSKTLSVAFKK